MAEISHIIVPVSDIEKSKDFYVNKLGMKVANEEKQGNRRVVILKTKEGYAYILLEVGEAAMQTSAPKVVVGWAVDDVMVFKKELEKKGVVMAGPIVEFEKVRVMTITDPDGNGMQFVENA